LPNLDDSSGAACGEVCLGEDVEAAGGASAELAERSSDPASDLFLVSNRSSIPVVGMFH